MRKLTQIEFIQRSTLAHNGQYDYSQSVYINQNEKLVIICEKHGEFLQRPADHMTGKTGCPRCGYERGRHPINKKDLLQRAHKIHNNKFEYDLSDYRDDLGIEGNTIRIKCKDHGWKEISAKKHIFGCVGCLLCSKKAIPTTEQWISAAIKMHGDRYDYTNSKYINSKTPIEIICEIHGSFKQFPNGHIKAGQHCPRCASYGLSRVESEWLDELGVEMRDVRLHGLKFDGFDPKTNTVYEFNGDFWHGNPEFYDAHLINKVNKKTFGSLYLKTIERERKIRDLGYNLVTIWESTYRKQKTRLLGFL